jgi:hypothetical protein
MQNEIIIECGVEGGSWTLVGRRGDRGGWRFRTTRNETALLDLMSEEDREEADLAGFEPYGETDWVVSWEAALALFDAQPWASLFCPIRVHPDFAERIWAAVQERCSEQDESARYNFKAWHRVCHGGNFE